MNQVELLRHVADNLEADRLAGFGLQYNGSASAAGNIMAIQWYNYEIYTLAPRTHEVNRFTVPAPLTEPPAKGTYYYVPSLFSINYTNSTNWGGCAIDQRAFSRGLTFATNEAAQQNALAMIGRDPALGVEEV
jgi:hypothetical protein